MHGGDSCMGGVHAWGGTGLPSMYACTLHSAVSRDGSSLISSSPSCSLGLSVVPFLLPLASLQPGPAGAQGGRCAHGGPNTSTLRQGKGAQVWTERLPCAHYWAPVALSIKRGMGAHLATSGLQIAVVSRYPTPSPSSLKIPATLTFQSQDTRHPHPPVSRVKIPATLTF